MQSMKHCKPVKRCSQQRCMLGSKNNSLVSLHVYERSVSNAGHVSSIEKRTHSSCMLLLPTYIRAHAYSGSGLEARITLTLCSKKMKNCDLHLDSSALLVPSTMPKPLRILNCRLQRPPSWATETATSIQGGMD